MGLFSRKKQKAPVLVLDVGSASIGGAIFKVNEGGLPLVLGSYRLSMAFQEDLNYDSFLSATLRTIREVVRVLHERSEEKPNQIHIVLSSPWFMSINRDLFYKDKTFKISKKKLDQLVTDDLKDYKKTLDKRWASGMTIETHIMKTKVKGYEIPNPYGKEADSLSVQYFASLVSSKVEEAMRNGIISLVHNEDIHFHSFPMMALTTMREISVVPENFFILDLNGEITDLMIIKDNSMVSNTSFPLGQNFVLRWVAKELGSTSHDALSSLRLYSENKLESNTRKKIKEVLDHVGEEWLKELTKAFDRISKVFLLPQDLFLFGNEPFSKIFPEFIKKESLERYIKSANSFRITPVVPEIADVLYSKKDMPKADTGIALSSRFINTLIGARNKYDS